MDINGTDGFEIIKHVTTWIERAYHKSGGSNK